MKICVIGTGYVGLVAGTCLAEMGNDVICVDNNPDKLRKLMQGIVPIYEPGLEELIKSNICEGRLEFSGDITAAVQASTVCFIAVGTPQNEDGSADMQYVESVAHSIGQAVNKYTVIVNKSTVPVGTADKVAGIIGKYADFEFDVVSNPEFLKQGAAVEDFLRPDRVVIGSNSQRATEIMQEIYAPFLRNGNPVIVMDIKSAEMTKYAANSFLAVKISYINEIANLCEKVGADADMVRVGMITDKRIGPQFLYPGLGYGGSCFPKDVKALLKTARDNGCSHRILSSADAVNWEQREIFIQKILARFGANLTGKTFAVWGLAFKPKTNDMRMAPAITVIDSLLEHGACVQVFDPKATESAMEIWGSKITYCKTFYEAVEDADCLLLLTEWNEFRHPDFDKVKSLMKYPVIFDGRNQYDLQRMTQRGFEYSCVGKTLPRLPVDAV
ncbi:MAG: UDP-glucose/GDP-mannose dehydrogenase family protein [Heliobacteriaceae bacterium]|jgi:UDPglucose 6-dehydrogenase|nr:UDP-glucose/GDP-mannose dehydrogenase family protein [Heliobacteriaceae bacterium]